ncbi:MULTISPECIES: serpin family protein [Psychrobacter]|uniref:serpin family protein n=1 Tax=Psychrobacter TaxID=497 RepID=UPI000EE12BE4|nr:MULTISPECIES: serpin family protein [Psychrobacter]HCR87445.1 serpin family protein [Psychrobacter sp.]
MKNRNQYTYKNPTIKLSLSTLALGSLLAIAGCNNSLVDNQQIKQAADKPIVRKTENPSTPKTDKNYIAADDSASTPEGIKQVVNANNQFAIDLYQQINKQPAQSDKNIFFSPYSLSTAMAMLYAAAEGETKQQIQKTFHYPTPAILNPNSAALYNQFNKPNPNYDLSTVNDLWMRQGLSPIQNYLDTVKRYYGGQVTNLDFASRPEPSRQAINKTISNHTKQMIPELLPEGSIKSSTAAVLTNAVYFKSEWAQPLGLRGSTQPFYNLNGTTTDTNFMYSIESFDYMEDERVQVVELPYKGDELSMLVVLPKSKEAAAMQKLIANLSTAQINKWTERLESKEIFLNMPKFKLEQIYKMESILTEMGMPIAFSNKADFSLFNDKLPLAVDSVIHKAVVEVDEKGTVAAAATSIVITPISASYNAEFTADHPFMFMIKDNKTDAILFLGQVNKL